MQITQSETDEGKCPLTRTEDGAFVNAAGERFVEVSEGIFVAEDVPVSEEERKAYYARYERPHFSPLRIVLQIALPLAAAVGLAAGLYFLLRRLGAGWPLGACIGVAAGALGLYLLLRLKSIIIFIVRCYQRFAPLSALVDVGDEGAGVVPVVPAAAEHHPPAVAAPRVEALRVGAVGGVERLERARLKVE